MPAEVIVLIIIFVVLPLLQQLLEKAREAERRRQQPPPQQRQPQQRERVRPAPRRIPEEVVRPEPVRIREVPSVRAAPAAARIRRPKPLVTLRNPRELRRAVVMMTVLGPCRANRPHEWQDSSSRRN
ncbi:MAG: hypothetical protein ACK5AZ_19140 [Bryobacteraceae bacterium]